MNKNSKAKINIQRIFIFAFQFVYWNCVDTLKIKILRDFANNKSTYKLFHDIMDMN